MHPRVQHDGGGVGNKALWVQLYYLGQNVTARSLDCPRNFTILGDKGGGIEFVVQHDLFCDERVHLRGDEMGIE